MPVAAVGSSGLLSGFGSDTPLSGNGTISSAVISADSTRARLIRALAAASASSLMGFDESSAPPGLPFSSGFPLSGVSSGLLSSLDALSSGALLTSGTLPASELAASELVDSSGTPETSEPFSSGPEVSDEAASGSPVTFSAPSVAPSAFPPSFASICKFRVKGKVDTAVISTARPSSVKTSSCVAVRLYSSVLPLSSSLWRRSSDGLSPLADPLSGGCSPSGLLSSAGAASLAGALPSPEAPPTISSAYVKTGIVLISISTAKSSAVCFLQPILFSHPCDFIPDSLHALTIPYFKQTFDSQVPNPARSPKGS